MAPELDFERVILFWLETPPMPADMLVAGVAVLAAMVMQPWTTSNAAAWPSEEA